MGHPRIRLAFYSSLPKADIDGILKFIWRENLNQPIEKDLVVFDRTYGRRIKTQVSIAGFNKDEVDYVHDLSMIWDAEVF